MFLHYLLKWVQLGSSGFGFTYNDADGDAATKYEVKTNSNGHKFWLPSNKNFYANGAVELPANEIDNFGLRTYWCFNTNCRV